MLLTTAPFQSTYTQTAKTKSLPRILWCGTDNEGLPDRWSGFIYSDFNQGNADDAETVRAGFYGTVSVRGLRNIPRFEGD